MQLLSGHLIQIKKPSLMIQLLRPSVLTMAARLSVASTVSNICAGIAQCSITVKELQMQ